MSTTMLKRDLGTGDLCDNIGLVGVSAKWSYVTASPSHHDHKVVVPLHNYGAASHICKSVQ